MYEYVAALRGGVLVRAPELRPVAQELEIYYTMLCYAILYYTVLYYTILYDTILHYSIIKQNTI